MLERLRFNTESPAALASDLDRLVDALRRELTVLEARCERRLRLVPGRKVGEYQAAFEDLVKAATAVGPVAIKLPAATPGDFGRQVVVVRRNAGGSLTVEASAGQVLNNQTGPVAMAGVVGAFPIRWDGEAWWTTEGS